MEHCEEFCGLSIRSSYLREAELKYLCAAAWSSRTITKIKIHPTVMEKASNWQMLASVFEHAYFDIIDLAYFLDIPKYSSLIFGALLRCPQEKNRTKVLDVSGFQSNFTSPLLMYLDRCPALTDLSLNSAQMAPFVFEELLFGLCKRSNLTRLDIGNCEWTEHACQFFQFLFLQNQQLNDLTISLPPISAEHILQLFQHRSLTKLKLCHHCPETDKVEVEEEEEHARPEDMERAKEKVKAREKAQAKKEALSKYAVWNHAEFFHYLAEWKLLTTLDISDCGLLPIDVEPLCVALLHSAVSDLNLSKNVKLVSASAQIAQFLQEDRNLVRLDVSFIPWGVHLQTLLTGFANKPIAELNLGHTGIPADGMHAICLQLAALPRLKWLSLKCNDMAMNAVAPLQHMAEGLRYLVLGSKTHSEFSEACVKVFLANPKLRHAGLVLENIQLKTAELLKDMIIEHPTLASFEFSGIMERNVGEVLADSAYLSTNMVSLSWDSGIFHNEDFQRRVDLMTLPNRVRAKSLLDYMSWREVSFPRPSTKSL